MPPNFSNEDSLNNDNYPRNKETLSKYDHSSINEVLSDQYDFSSRENLGTQHKLSNHNIPRNRKNLTTKHTRFVVNNLGNRDPILSNDEVFRVNSSVPDWLQDMLVNSLSFWRTGFWVADGRWRQWETFDCNDIDSIHNDFQRELPYILFFPGKLTK